MFDELRLAIEELGYLANPTAGEVRIGCNESLSAAVLPEVVTELAETHPGLVLHVAQMSRPIDEEARALRDRSVDLILARGLSQVPEDDLDARVLCAEPLVVVAGAQSRWARQAPRDLDALAKAKWILYPPGENPGALVNEAFRRRRLRTPAATVTTSSFHLRAALLARDDYVTIVPHCMIEVLNTHCAVVIELPVAPRIEPRPVAIFTLRNRTPNPLARIVIASIAAAAKVRCSGASGP